MGFIDKFVDREKVQNMTIASPRDVFKNILKHTSGAGVTREIKYNNLYQIYAFKGVVEGVGCSTLVANTALALADAGITVCVIDTSILQPVQDIILKTNYSNDSVKEKDRLDWFDMPFTKISPLHESLRNKNISVLSFYGKKRGIIDALSTNDNEALVELALTELHTKFDIILIDCCHELTSINAACLQQCQQVIQVWNDTPTVLSNIDNFITNCVTLSCPLDKMRYVVYSKVQDEVIGNMDVLLKQYRLKKLATCSLSKTCSLVLTTGSPLWQFASSEKDIEDYTNYIIDVAAHVLGIDVEKSGGRGTITSNDIMDGKVEGTLTKKMIDEQEKRDEKLDGVPRTLEEADRSLSDESISEDEDEQDESPEVVEEESVEKPKRGFFRRKK